MVRIPARAAPSQVVTHSGPLRAKRAIVSPGSRPSASSWLAAAVAPRSASAKVRVSSSKDRKTLSPNAEARSDSSSAKVKRRGGDQLKMSPTLVRAGAAFLEGGDRLQQVVGGGGGDLQREGEVDHLRRPGPHDVGHDPFHALHRQRRGGGQAGGAAPCGARGGWGVRRQSGNGAAPRRLRARGGERR